MINEPICHKLIDSDARSGNDTIAVQPMKNTLYLDPFLKEQVPGASESDVSHGSVYYKELTSGTPTIRGGFGWSG